MKLLVAALLAVLVLSACQGSDGETHEADVIRVAYLPITHSAAVMMLPYVSAASDEFSIELVRFTTWPEVVEALRSGHVEGASLLFEVAVTAFQMGSPLAVVSLSHRDGNVLVVDNTVIDIHCLVGRTVAIPHTLSPHLTLLNKVLTEAGLSLDDINLVEISPAEMPFSMAARAISAYVVAEPWGSLAEQRGAGRILVDSRDIIPNSVCCLLVFSTDVLEAYEGLLDWLMYKFYVASLVTAAGSEAVVEEFRSITGFEREIINRSLANTNFYYLEFTRDDFDITVENVLRFGVLEDFPEFSDFVAVEPDAALPIVSADPEDYD